MSKARPWKLARVFLLLLFVVSFMLGLAGQVLAQGASDKTALVADVDGIINPISQRYITGTVEKGEDEGAEVVIILLNTPGGLSSSTREIYETLLNASVPTVVFVSPRGAQAASAGTFITAAANVAVMAPGTSIGAATPVGAGGEDLPQTLADKATNAAAADIRAIATQRERNVQQLENTVILAMSFSAEEAVELNVVDFIARDLEDLLIQLDGLTVTVGDETRTLSTRDVQIERLNMGLINRVLYILADPNISFLLLTLGGLGLVVELWSPGLVIPGLTGAVFLVLAFISLGNLPVNWGGAALILVGLALITLELFVSGFGVLGIGGIVSFILGGLLLFAHFGAPSPVAPSLGVSPWVLWPTVAVVAIIGAWVITTIVRQHKMEKVLDLSPLIGSEAVVTSALDPRGTVRVNTEIWTAYCDYGTMIPVGGRVRVVAVEGAVLKVTSVEGAENPSQSEPGQ